MPEDNNAPPPPRGAVARDVSITVGGQPLRLQTPNFDGLQFDVAAPGSDRTAPFYARRDPINGTLRRVSEDEVMRWRRPDEMSAPTWNVGIAEAEQAAAPARAILDKMLEMARNIRRIKAAAAERHTPPTKFVGGDDETP